MRRQSQSQESCPYQWHTESKTCKHLYCIYKTPRPLFYVNNSHAPLRFRLSLALTTYELPKVGSASFCLLFHQEK